MFGKTYGKNTFLSKNEQYLKGFDVPADTRFKSLVQDSFVNQRELSKTLVGPLSPTKVKLLLCSLVSACFVSF